MKKKKTHLIFCAWILILSSFSCLGANNQPKLSEYYTSGEYDKDIEKKLTEAYEYLDRQLQSQSKSRLAIILDIDETALSNFKDLERLSFTRNPQALTGAYMLGGAEAIPAILKLYQQALSHHVAVFFVSERPKTPEIMAITIKNLKSVGFEQWEDLFLKPNEPANMTNQTFKTNTRRHIADLGYDIILNVGDQETDLRGGYAQARVKLPNPFYDDLAPNNGQL